MKMKASSLASAILMWLRVTTTILSIVLVSQTATSLPALGNNSATGSKVTELQKGKTLLEDNCSGCHAIGDSGRGSHPDAPHFRELSKNYPVAHLAEALAEGILVGHPDMPTFEFEAHEVEQIIQYLESIQSQTH